jgi:predicted MFS family arabinose efflux permease
LTVYTGAYLIAMSAGGAVAHRFGVDQALSFSAILFGAALCALLDASSEAWVAIALVVAGFLGGVVDLLMNAEGARIERRLGRPILARLHAAASAGMALGADPRQFDRRRPGALGGGRSRRARARRRRRRLSSRGQDSDCPSRQF